jgi:hypothetical protein
MPERQARKPAFEEAVEPHAGLVAGDRDGLDGGGDLGLRACGAVSIPRRRTRPRLEDAAADLIPGWPVVATLALETTSAGTAFVSLATLPGILALAPGAKLAMAAFAARPPRTTLEGLARIAVIARAGTDILARRTFLAAALAALGTRVVPALAKRLSLSALALRTIVEALALAVTVARTVATIRTIAMIAKIPLPAALARLVIARRPSAALIPPLAALLAAAAAAPARRTRASAPAAIASAYRHRCISMRSPFQVTARRVPRISSEIGCRLPLEQRPSM